MSDTHKQEPFRQLGQELKALRNSRKETLVEVSGAVEIDADSLSNYEQGTSRPSEDIVMLLMSYFKVKEDDAAKLWKLAGYDMNGQAVNQAPEDMVMPQIMLMPMDTRVIYTDLVHVTVNNYGTVINFMQNSGAKNQPIAVSRIGMSKEHAYSLLEVLKNTLEQADKPKEIRQLPPASIKTTTVEKRVN